MNSINVRELFEHYAEILIPYDDDDDEDDGKYQLPLSTSHELVLLGKYLTEDIVDLFIKKDVPLEMLLCHYFSKKWIQANSGYRAQYIDCSYWAFPYTIGVYHS